MPGPSVAALDLGATPDAWRDLGFTVDDEGRCAVGQTTLVLTGAGGGVLGWRLRDAEGQGPVDGIPTARTAAPPAPAPDHPNGAVAVDHVVVATPDIGRTFGALQATGMVLRRERDVGTPEQPMRQGFFRHGECIVEVVGPVEPESADPARLWGLTLIVADLEATAALLGDRLGSVRDAVQPGRRIATVRRDVLPGLPLALMTP